MLVSQGKRKRLTQDATRVLNRRTLLHMSTKPLECQKNPNTKQEQVACLDAPKNLPHLQATRGQVVRASKQAPPAADVLLRSWTRVLVAPALPSRPPPPHPVHILSARPRLARIAAVAYLGALRRP